MCKFRKYEKYEVYEDGRIWSYKTKRFLKPTTRKDGYQQVHLTDNEGKSKWYQLHRVVWESVTGSPIPEGYEINHRNEIKTDNRFFENLELVTHKENCNYGSRNERSAKSRINGKRSKQVGAYKDGELIFRFPSLNEARRQGFNSGHISDCCRNCYLREGNNVYKGYSWKYL